MGAELVINSRTRMRQIRSGYIFPSAACTIPRNRIHHYAQMDRKPEIGDLVYGTIAHIVQHQSLENKEGRIHAINSGSRAIFVLGNRYAPDYYEGFIPEELPTHIDLLSRSGVIGVVQYKSSLVKEPTQVKALGYVCDADGTVLNTRNFCRIKPKHREKTADRSKLILNIGTSMNSGKSVTAAACCWALTTMGHKVRGSKISGTAGLRDILLMEDNGASPVADFTFMGYPSTYMLDYDSLIGIFNAFDLKFANSPRNFWVVEVADGVLQRETAMILHSEEVRSRIHRLIFNARDAFGAIGGLDVLKKEFDLVPHAISGICSSSPLGIRELQKYTDLPIFNSVERDLTKLASILL
jgi:hypothetical protein